MNKKRILLTRMIPKDGLKTLVDDYELVIPSPDKGLTNDELLTHVKGVDAVIAMLSDRVDKRIIDAMDNCKVISNYAVGFNNIDTAYAKQKGIYVTNTPDVLTDATAEIALALLFAAARRVIEGDTLTRTGGFTGWAPEMLLGKPVKGARIGIIGAGRIGYSLASMVHGLGMEVIYYNRKPSAAMDELGAVYTPFDELIKTSDYISIHVPFTDATRYMIDEAQLSMMKSGAILINTSRGAVVNENALVAALKSGKLWAAGLDVYENEPALAEGLCDLPNVVLLPHLGSGTEQTRINMGSMVCKNVIEALSGKVPHTCVNQ